MEESISYFYERSINLIRQLADNTEKIDLKDCDVLSKELAIAEQIAMQSKKFQNDIVPLQRARTEKIAVLHDVLKRLYEAETDLHRTLTRAKEEIKSYEQAQENPVSLAELINYAKTISPNPVFTPEFAWSCDLPYPSNDKILNASFAKKSQ